LQKSNPQENSKRKKSWILDGFMIMNKFELDLPEQASSATITNHDINDIFEDDMKFFTNLTELNLKDNNKVPMYKLLSLPALEKLNLSFNKIHNLAILPIHIEGQEAHPKLFTCGNIKTPFKTLKFLNLSFNKLDFISLERLVMLQGSLKSLDISGNDLDSIPKDFKYFDCLESLNLSNN